MLTTLTKTVILVVGAGGEPEYGEAFSQWAGRFEAAAVLGGANVLRIGPGASEPGPESDRVRLEELLALQDRTGDDELWFVYLGHGTFDGTQSHLNLAGPDVSAGELARWLEPIERPTSIAICASASSPFVNALSRPGRVVVSATKSGHQLNYARFGDFLSRAIGDPGADLDKDEQVSLLEAFLVASEGVAAFYASESRLATEHALIDDNGDGLGTPASWFRGVRVEREPEGDGLPDGSVAHRRHLVESSLERSLPADVRRKRDDLEARLEGLRLMRAELEADDYYTRLERLMLELARLYQRNQPPEPPEDGGN